MRERRQTGFNAKNPVWVSAKTMAKGVLQRVGVYQYNQSSTSCYDGVECRIGTTYREIKDYIMANFSGDIERLLDEGKRPSLDRVDSNGHYEHGNLRVIDFYENSVAGAESTGRKYANARRNGDVKGRPSKAKFQ